MLNFAPSAPPVTVYPVMVSSLIAIDGGNCADGRDIFHYGKRRYTGEGGDGVGSRIHCNRDILGNGQSGCILHHYHDRRCAFCYRSEG